MSKVVTPPDIINEPFVLLVVNASIDDIEMVAEWLRYCDKNYTIHLYQDVMGDPAWLAEVAKSAETILVHRTNTKDTNIQVMYDDVAKIKWFGDGQIYATATDYLVKNG